MYTFINAGNEYIHVYVYVYVYLYLKKSRLGSHHALVAAYTAKLGHVYLLKSEYDKAVDMFQNAMMINETLHGVSSQAVAASCQLLAEAMWHRSEVNEAYKYAKRALSIREGEYGAGHRKTMQVYHMIK